MLANLLRCLAAQDTRGEFDFSVVVINNDDHGSARDTVSRAAAEWPLDVTYDVGAVNTIPAARNHALRLARGNYVGIIDDDEFPPPLWLSTLYRAVRTFEVDGALGPVIPYFECAPPEWLIRGRFCERPTHRTGTLLQWQQTRTGNVLIRRGVFERQGLLFDERFTTGGSDREFFKHAMASGYRFIAVEEAPVYEVVPPERQTKRYWVRRALVNGYNAHKNSAGALHGLARVTLPITLAGAACLCAAALPFSLLAGTHATVRCLERGGHHLSRLCGMMGIELLKKRDL
jgi:GT2 family glycosyltransferase